MRIKLNSKVLIIVMRMATQFPEYVGGPSKYFTLASSFETKPSEPSAQGEFGILDSHSRLHPLAPFAPPIFAKHVQQRTRAYFNVASCPSA